MNPRALAALRRIAETVLEAERARLAAAQARGKAAADAIDALDAAVRRQADVTAAELEAPVAGHVVDRFGAWAERRRAALNTTLAQERVRVETQRLATTEAFARAEALRRIEAASMHRAAQASRRRASRRGD